MRNRQWTRHSRPVAAQTTRGESLILDLEEKMSRAAGRGRRALLGVLLSAPSLVAAWGVRDNDRSSPRCPGVGAAVFAVSQWSPWVVPAAGIARPPIETERRCCSITRSCSGNCW